MSSEITVSENKGFMTLETIEQALKVSEIISTSSFCPKGMFGKPGDILVCLQMGQELGLKPMQALQNIAVINGRPSLWGDAMLGVCRQSPDFEYIKEEFDNKTMTATCVVKRKLEPEFIQSFSQADAKLAGLWGKQGPWVQYPKRMLQMRARGFALRDSFPDLLRGIIIKEEAEDYPKSKTDYSRAAGVTIEGESDVIDFVSEEQLNQFLDKANEASADLSKICQHLNIENVEQMTTSQWPEVMRQLDKKILAKQKTENLPINQFINETYSDTEVKEFFEGE